MIHLDQLNRKLQLKVTPKRIVSLVPSQTELLIDLGLESTVVGVTKFCVHPKQIRKDKTIVGGTKDIQLQKIKDLQPDIILCNKEENTKDIIKELEPVAPIHISDINNLKDCYQLINMYGKLFNVMSKASEIIDNIQKEREQFQHKIKAKEKRKVAYFIWKNPWMVAASNTFIDFMLKEAGFKNVFEFETRYPEVDLENLKLDETDCIFLSSEPYPFKEKQVLELKSYFPQNTTAIVDGEMFSWYGSRLQKAYKYFLTLHN
ncbi:ABC transporter substrate-binding protein [Winogradskyella sp.]|jgi:ABC-type Fe3+-hydroxamate transport system substrate-binding protein|uniref:ABC transporter substrate-binding protein n=1 Tax=Winogradskyella sp. TaxID=1883156 RepID=UPI0025E1AC56|nr:helical backbone metal receptor [Winogradskyella sp.]MCT4630430.1 helical backbone metal receptor [Winogradskyella sp.]